MNIFDFINAKQISLYLGTVPPVTTIDQALFPNDKQLGMEMELAKGKNQKPVALRMSQFDVAVRPRVMKAELNIEKRELPFFKESILIREKDRQQLLLAISANNQNLVDFILKQVYNNYLALVQGAEIQAKRMRTQLIQKGEINIVTPSGDIVVDYGVPVEHKETISDTSKKWSNPAADIVGDIERWQKIFTDEGKAKPTRLLLTSKTFGYIRKNAAILAEIRGLTNPIVTEQMVIAYLNNKLGVQIAILNGTFVNEEGTTLNYYEDNIVTLIPPGTLGRTVFGTTPEEVDKIYGTSKLDTEIVNTGVAITTMVKEDPVTVETKVSSMCLPSFEGSENCFFAVVA